MLPLIDSCSHLNWQKLESFNLDYVLQMEAKSHRYLIQFSYSWKNYTIYFNDQYLTQNSLLANDLHVFMTIRTCIYGLMYANI